MEHGKVPQELLTGSVEARGDGVQKRVLGRQQPFHHRHGAAVGPAGRSSDAGKTSVVRPTPGSQGSAGVTEMGSWGAKGPWREMGWGGVGGRGVFLGGSRKVVLP